MHTINNDQNYKILDYPPLSAYHSFICGIFSRMFDPPSVELFSSRGYETRSH